MPTVRQLTDLVEDTRSDTGPARDYRLMDRPNTVPLYVQHFAHFWCRHSTELIIA